VRRLHQGQADEFPDRRFEIEDRIVAEADRILAECPQDEEDLIRHYNADPAKITIIPCGFDPTELAPISKPLARFALNLPPEERVILQLGRMVPRKGVDTVIAALRQLPDADLVIAGGSPDDEETERLRELALAYGLQERVHLIGSVPRTHVPALMRSADVVVTVPWYEPFGMVPVEAMACGVPVVASAVGGHLDTVAGCGVLVPPRRPRALARALRDVLNNPGRREALGAAGARRARERYGWARVAEQTEAVYTQVIDGKLCRLAALGG
jgi:glycosyltransferase involved in cell wall biosynthesis